MTALPPNRELVVFGLSLLGGSTDRVHTEDIAVKCHEMFPDSFSWTKYPQYPLLYLKRLSNVRKNLRKELPLSVGCLIHQYSFTLPCRG